MGRPRRTALIRWYTSAVAASSLERPLGQYLAGFVQGDGRTQLLLPAVEAVPRSLVRERGDELAARHLDGGEALDGRVVPGFGGVAVPVAPVDGLDQPTRVVDPGVEGVDQLLAAEVRSRLAQPGHEHVGHYPARHGQL